MDQKMSAVTPTKDIRFYDIETSKGIFDGFHGIKTASVSSMAHNEIAALIHNSNSKSEYTQALNEWADKHVGVNKDGKIAKGREGLPEDIKHTKKCETA